MNKATHNITTKMRVHLVPKKETQKMIKALRDAGLVVSRDSMGMYTCAVGKPDTRIELFNAMPGRSGYLVRMRADLFE